MIEHLTNDWPVLLALLVYFLRLENRLGKICADLAWLKKYIHACQRN